MLWNISRWARGYLRLRIRGYGAERFFNLLRSAGLGCWDIRQRKDGYYLSMGLGDFHRIRPLLFKSHVSMRIVQRAGLPFFLRRHRKRKAFACAVLSFFALLYAMSLFIWDISFEGNYHYSRDTLLDYLASGGVRYGMAKSGVSCDELEEGIRSAFPEVTWVSARVSGTRLLVKIKENEALSAVPVEDQSPCELIAANSGIITRVIVRQGKAMVAPGDEVEEGQVLIGGQLSIMNDAGEVARTAFVHADGEVYARTRYRYEETFSRYRAVAAKTGKKRHGARVTAGSCRIGILMPESGENFWRYVSDTIQLRLFGDFYLPLYVENIEGEEFVTYERPYRQEEKEEEARRLQEYYQKNLMEKGVQIIENNVKILEDGVLWKVEGLVTGQEQIGKARYLAQPEKMEETKDADERD